jgi:hypothetical protein
VVLTEGVTVKELSEKTEIKSQDSSKSCWIVAFSRHHQPTSRIEVAKQLCREFGYEASIISFEEDAIREQVTSAAHGKCQGA